MRHALRVARPGLCLALVLAAQLFAGLAIAGPFSQLQVLVPGRRRLQALGPARLGLRGPRPQGFPSSSRSMRATRRGTRCPR